MPAILYVALVLAAEPGATTEPLMFPPATPRRVQAAIDGGVGFLIAEGAVWREKRGCAACHHVPEMILGLSEARRAGYAVDGAILSDAISWSLAEDNRGRLLDPFKNPQWVGLNGGSMYIAIAAGMVELDAGSRAGLTPHFKHLLEQQRPDGGWQSLDNSRPPLGDTPEVTTRLALWALTHPAAAEILGEAPLAESRRKAHDFLAGHPPTTQQGLALSLILGPPPVAPAELPSQWADQLLALQRPDGGFSQADDLNSDAFATGQSLLALARVGIPRDDPRVARAVSFLVNAQLPDGSWPMSSRPTLLGKPPAKILDPIIYTGSGWAVAGLAASYPRRPLQTTQK